MFCSQVVQNHITYILFPAHTHTMYTESNIRVDESASVNLDFYCGIYAEKTVEQFC